MIIILNDQFMARIVQSRIIIALKTLLVCWFWSVFLVVMSHLQNFVVLVLELFVLSLPSGMGSALHVETAAATRWESPSRCRTRGLLGRAGQARNLIWRGLRRGTAKRLWFGLCLQTEIKVLQWGQVLVVWIYL